MLYTLRTTAEDKSYHPALAAADFSQVGLLGHSEGGGSAAFAAADHDGVNVTAVVLLNAWSTPAISEAATAIRMPVLWGTGSSDPIASPKSTEDNFNLSLGEPRALVVIKGGGHFDPCATG